MKKGKRALAFLLSVILALSTFNVIGVIASAADSYVPVTVYVKAATMTAGETYLIGIREETTVAKNDLSLTTVTTNSSGTTAYYTNSSGSDILYSAANSYIIDETNAAFSSNEFVWKNGNSLFNAESNQYLTTNSATGTTVQMNAASNKSLTYSNSRIYFVGGPNNENYYLRYSPSNGYVMYLDDNTNSLITPYLKTTVYKKVSNPTENPADPTENPADPTEDPTGPIDYPVDLEYTRKVSSLYTPKTSGQILEEGKYYIYNSNTATVLVASAGSSGLNASDDVTIGSNTLSTFDGRPISVTVADAENNLYYFQNSDGKYISISNGSVTLSDTADALKAVTSTSYPGNIGIADSTGTYFLNASGTAYNASSTSFASSSAARMTFYSESYYYEYTKYSVPSSGQLLSPGNYIIYNKERSTMLTSTAYSNDGGIYATKDYKFKGNTVVAGESEVFTVTVENGANNLYCFRTQDGRYLSIGSTNALTSAKLTSTKTVLKVIRDNGDVRICNQSGTPYLNAWDEISFGVYNGTETTSTMTLYAEKEAGTGYMLTGQTEFTVTQGDNINIDSFLNNAQIVRWKIGDDNTIIPWNDASVTYEWDTFEDMSDLDAKYQNPILADAPGKYFLWVYVDGNLVDKITVKIEPETPVAQVTPTNESFRVRLFNYGSAINKYTDGQDTTNFLNFFENNVENVDGVSKNKGIPYTSKPLLGSDGCPVIVAGGYNRSLGYLFDPDMGAETGGFVQGNGTATEYDPLNNSDYQSMKFDVGNENGSGLFQLNENGYFYYDSQQNAAWYNPDTGLFELYDYVMHPLQGNSDGSGGNFFPFNKADEQGNMIEPETANSPALYRLRGDAKHDEGIITYEDSNDMWFGMSIEFDFYMPEGGLVDGKETEFHFSGDDDVWVYIDDVLVLDMGGTHPVFNGSINFATGEVYYESNSENADGEGKNTETTTIRRCFQNAYGSSLDTSILDGDTLADYGRHTIRFFYMERGGNLSDLKVEFNVPPVPSGNFEVSKKASGYSDDAEHTFYLTDETDAPIANMEYTSYNLIDTTETFNGQTDDNGSFSIHGNEGAIFNFTDGSKVRVREEGSVEYRKTTCEVNGKTYALNDDLSTELFTIQAGRNTVVRYYNNTITIYPPLVVVVDYGKSMPAHPLDNDTHGLSIKGILDHEGESGDTIVAKENKINLKNGTAELVEEIDNSKPAGIIMAVIELGSDKTTAYPLTRRAETLTFDKAQLRYYIGANGKIQKYVAYADSISETIADSLADGKFVIDDENGHSYMFFRSGNTVYVVEDYTLESGTKYAKTTGKTISTTKVKLEKSKTKTLGTIDGVTYSIYMKDGKNFTIYGNDTTIATIGKEEYKYTYKLSQPDVNGDDLTIVITFNNKDEKNSYISYPEFTLDNVNYEVKMGGHNDYIVYAPFKYMSCIDRVHFYCDVPGEDTNSNLIDGKVHSTVTFIPATTVYYEDDFGGSEENGGLYIKYTGDWYTITDDGSSASGVEANTSTDNSSHSRQDRGDVGGGYTPYGYDSSYDGDTKFSNGSAAVVEGSMSMTDGKPSFNAYATFTFTGTGFDIISRTDLDCGMITVLVHDHETGEFVAQVPVINKGVNNLYQIPVVSFTDYVPYGTYDVTINVNAPSKFLGIEGSTFYLDAIRIYDPMGKSSDDNDEYDEAYAAYQTDKEANAFVASIRDFIIQAGSLDSSEQYGAVYVDTLTNDYDIGGMIGNIKNPEFTEEERRTRAIDKDKINTLQQVGPNEEVYLSPGYGVGFIVESNMKPESIQLEIKIPVPFSSSSTSTLSVQTYGNASSQKNFNVYSAAEMFYDITDAVVLTESNGLYRATVILSNGLPNSAQENEIVSITNIKMTYAEGTNVVNNAPKLLKASAVNPEPFTPEYAYNAEMEALAKCNVAVTSLKASENTYKQVFDTVYVQRQASTPVYDVVNAKIADSTVEGNYEEITFNTAIYVDEVEIVDENGVKLFVDDVNCRVDESKRFTDDYMNTKTWTAKVKVPVGEGVRNFTVKAVNGEGAAETMPVVVAPSRITKLEVVKAPEKTAYKFGDEIITNGLELKATYNNGEIKTVTEGFTLENTKADTEGNMSVGVEFEGSEAQFNVTVKKTFIQKLVSFFTNIFSFITKLF